MLRRGIVGSLSLTFFISAVSSLVIAVSGTPSHAASVILNEYNAVDDANLLANGASDPFWGRRNGNGNDWFELAVISDGLDMRNWEFVVSNNTGDLFLEESWSIKLTAHDVWSNIRSGTIITISEDLANNVSDYEPAIGNWWLNVRASRQSSGTYATVECIAPSCLPQDANWKVSNNNWQVTIKNSGGTMIFGPAGEGVHPSGGVGGIEVLKLEQDPSATVTPFSNYNDGASSTFGQPNTWSGGTLSQDFSALRSVLPYSALGDVRINEVATHEDPSDDWVELVNTTDSDVNIGDWYLSDSFATLTEYKIPGGTIIPAHGYLVFDQNQLGFALSAACGDEVILSVGNGTQPTGPRDFVKFGPAENGRTLGRYPNGNGGLVRLSGATPGSPNGIPNAEAVVISEIMYHPPTAPLGITADLEFVELANTTASTVALSTDFGVDGEYGWRLRGGVDFDFALGTTIPASGHLLVVAFDPILDPTSLTQFRDHYGVSPSVPIVGPYSGGLSNFSDRLRVRMPDTPEADGNICGGTGNPSPYVPYVITDELTYFDSGDWPTSPDGDGPSLERINTAAPAGDPTNWAANPLFSSSPGSPNATHAPLGKVQQKCLNTSGKLFTKLAKLQGTESCRCLRDGSRNSIAPLTVDECLVADRFNKVTASAAKNILAFNKVCSGNDGNGVPRLPFIGPRDGGTINDEAAASSVDIMDAIFGFDVDGATADAETDSDRATCQYSLARDVKKCMDAQNKLFGKCVKTGLKLGSLTDAGDLGACIGSDPKGKLTKTCSGAFGRIASDLSKRCEEDGVNLLAAFPGCGSADRAVVGACLESAARCQVCMKTNNAMRTLRDCDAYDDGSLNASCP